MDSRQGASKPGQQLARTQKKLAKAEQQIKVIRLRQRLRRLNRDRGKLVGQFQDFVIGAVERVFGGAEKK